MNMLFDLANFTCSLKTQRMVKLKSIIHIHFKNKVTGITYPFLCIFSILGNHLYPTLLFGPISVLEGVEGVTGVKVVKGAV